MRAAGVRAWERKLQVVGKAGHRVRASTVTPIFVCSRGLIDIQSERISFMQVSKWGNSLAVRLPAVVVEALDLKEGDEIEISIAGKRDFKVARDRSKDRALEQLRQMKWSFPPDFKFDREKTNER
jgi:antitoxin MazE